MSYQLLPPDVLRVGQPTRFALRDKTGCLLVPKGTLVADSEQLQQLAARELYVDEQDGEALKRAMAGKLHELVRGNQLLGRIAQAQPDASDMVVPSAAGTRRLDDALTAWSNLQMRVAALLRDPSRPTSPPSSASAADAARPGRRRRRTTPLLLLVHGATQEFRDYSASHAVLVAVLCELAARQLPGISPAERGSLRCAALTMNVGDDRPAGPAGAAGSAAARRSSARRSTAMPQRGVQALRAAGVDRRALAGRRGAPPRRPAGPLAAQDPAHAAGAADAARRHVRGAPEPAPRAPALSATAAAKAAYLDEHGQPDEAGSAIIKATGLYPPGSYVRLASGELARGAAPRPARQGADGGQHRQPGRRGARRRRRCAPPTLPAARRDRRRGAARGEGAALNLQQPGCR